MVSYSNFSEKLALIKSGQLSLSENVDFFLQKIRDNSDLNAYNFVFEDAAKKRALEVEAKIKSGNFGKLAGLVIAIKDVLSLKDNPLTCSSKILKDFEAVYTATALQKLLDEDAIIIGKTNCDEFAMGSSNENSAFGPALNPVDKDYVPGGSSGGSAVAVAAGLCDVSLGTDTGGSIRQPASYCGIVGMKPTYGLVSRFGLTAFASSFDTIGPFANNVEDAELLLSVIAGFDENDSTSVEHQYTPDEKNLDEIVIGLPKEYFGEGTDEEVNKSLQEAISTLKNNGVKFKEISLPHTEYTIATYYILTTAEASSNLSRYDGARYGYRSENVADLAEMYENSRSEGFGDEVKRRIMLGTYVLSAGYYDAYYLKAQKVRRLIREDFDKAFEGVDFILTPTTPGTAFKLGENIDDPLKMYMLDIFTTSANLAGIPGISLPVKNVTGNMPVGLQLFGNRLSDAGLFSAAKQIFSLL